MRGTGPTSVLMSLCHILDLFFPLFFLYHLFGVSFGGWLVKVSVTYTFKLPEHHLSWTFIWKESWVTVLLNWHSLWHALDMHTPDCKWFKSLLSPVLFVGWKLPLSGTYLFWVRSCKKRIQSEGANFLRWSLSSSYWGSWQLPFSPDKWEHSLPPSPCLSPTVLDLGAHFPLHVAWLDSVPNP